MSGSLTNHRNLIPNIKSRKKRKLPSIVRKIISNFNKKKAKNLFRDTPRIIVIKPKMKTDLFKVIGNGSFNTILGNDNDVIRLRKKNWPEFTIHESKIQNILADSNISIPVVLVDIKEVVVPFQGDRIRSVGYYEVHDLDMPINDETILGMKMERLEIDLFDKYEKKYVPPMNEFIHEVLQLIKLVLQLSAIGYVHSDIKPENVAISKDRNLFLLDNEFVAKHGKKMHFNGTPEYMPLEKLKSFTEEKFYKKIFKSEALLPVRYFDDIYAVLMTIGFMLRVSKHHYYYKSSPHVEYQINIEWGDSSSEILDAFGQCCVENFENLYGVNEKFSNLISALVEPEAYLWESVGHSSSNPRHRLIECIERFL